MSRMLSIWGQTDLTMRKVRLEDAGLENSLFLCGVGQHPEHA